MNKIVEAIKTSVQVYPTATSGISGSTALDVSTYRNVVAKLYAHRLPDAKGEGVITLSLFEHTAATLNGTQVAASVVTGSITSASDVYLEKEITVTDLTKRYVYARVSSSTSTVVAVTIEQGTPRYEKV